MRRLITAVIVLVMVVTMLPIYASCASSNG